MKAALGVKDISMSLACFLVVASCMWAMPGCTIITTGYFLGSSALALTQILILLVCPPTPEPPISNAVPPPEQVE